MKNKNFDAVKMMRTIRDSLSKKYTLDPDLEQKDLEKIRKKYNINVKKLKTLENYIEK
jgi:hypothetical protein